nr:hypothetical protein CFP56_43174 [Quercus suber]
MTNSLLVQWFGQFNSDFKAVNVKSPLESTKYSQAWKLPTDVVFRVNVDAAIFFSQRMCGVGVVIRDEMGLVFGGAHGFDVVADVADQGNVEVVYQSVVVVLLMVDWGGAVVCGSVSADWKVLGLGGGCIVDGGSVGGGVVDGGLVVGD